jgi:hypothetical protein
MLSAYGFPSHHDARHASPEALDSLRPTPLDSQHPPATAAVCSALISRTLTLFQIASRTGTC